MAGIPDYSTTAASNTTVGGISIAEGMAPSGVNNAIRAVMADLATMTKGGARVAELTVASATTCDILGALSNLIAISGTTTITSLGTGASRLKFVRFTGALTLTHNATSLILPGGGNITTAAGDCMIIESDASSNVRVLSYTPAAGNTWLGATSAEVTVASASTTNILGAASALVAISGTTTITSLGTGANVVKFVRFTGILTLTHNATSLILPTGANITTAAGDCMIVESDGSSNVRVLSYQRASGAALAGGSGVVTVKTQVFTGSGTYTPSTGMLYAVIECIGGGGGGGGAANTTAGAGGGGAGGASRKLVSAADIGASKAVTIGALGAGGAAGSNNGSAGGDTSVGILCVGKGGSGGVGSSASAAGGAGGIAGTGDVAGVGAPGIGGVTTMSGGGGSAAYGGGGKGIATATSAGNAGAGYGAGGGGAISNSGGTRAGGDGTAGIVIITEYCSQ